GGAPPGNHQQRHHVLQHADADGALGIVGGEVAARFARTQHHIGIGGTRRRHQLGARDLQFLEGHLQGGTGEEGHRDGLAQREPALQQLGGALACLAVGLGVAPPDQRRRHRRPDEAAGRGGVVARGRNGTAAGQKQQSHAGPAAVPEHGSALYSAATSKTTTGRDMSQRPRILLTRRWPREVEEYLAGLYDVTLNEIDVPMTGDALRAAMREYDALCPTVTDRIDASVLEVPGRRVRLIGNFGVGFNHIDVEAARRLSIRVSNTPDVLTDTTADLAILLMLMATRRAGEGERELRAGRWTGWRPTHMLGQSLTGKLLGLVGFGRIAQATARKAHAAFGMRIGYYGR